MYLEATFPLEPKRAKSLVAIEQTSYEERKSDEAKIKKNQQKNSTDF
jgi:hypothetical protein